jgi:hypothetical protein
LPDRESMFGMLREDLGSDLSLFIIAVMAFHCFMALHPIARNSLA